MKADDERAGKEICGEVDLSRDVSNAEVDSQSGEASVGRPDEVVHRPGIDFPRVERVNAQGAVGKNEEAAEAGMIVESLVDRAENDERFCPADVGQRNVRAMKEVELNAVDLGPEAEA